MKRKSSDGQEFKAYQEQQKQQIKHRPVRPDFISIFLEKLGEDYTPQDAKRVYWELSQQYHPNNGGHQLDWLSLQSAFEVFGQE